MFTEAAPVPALPAGPVFERYLLESPWMVVIALLLAVVLTVIIGNRSGKFRPSAFAAAGLALLAGVIALVAELTVTTGELLRARSRELVDLVARPDVAGIRARLDSSCELTLGLTGPRLSHSAIFAGIDRFPGGAFPIEEHAVMRESAVVDGSNIARTQLRIRVRSASTLYNVPVSSWWRIDWRADPVLDPADPDSWRVVRITLLQVDGVENVETLRGL
jgi:hypothetical protein